ncbi:MAG: hypothetical protein RL292_249, partial [Candidatus Parcubacteria bacterium]
EFQEETPFLGIHRRFKQKRFYVRHEYHTQMYISKNPMQGLFVCINKYIQETNIDYIKYLSSILFIPHPPQHMLQKL